LRGTGERDGLVCFLFLPFYFVGKHCKSLCESMQRIPDVGGGSHSLCGVLIRALK